MTLAVFRKYVLMQSVLNGVFIASSIVLHSSGFLSLKEALLLFMIFFFSAGVIYPDLMIERLSDIYGGREISGIAIGIYTLFPLTNILLLSYCLLKESRTGEERWFPVLSKVHYAIILFFFMFSQSVMFGFGLYSPRLIKYHAWINSPSNQKVAYVAAQARMIFQMKDKHLGKTNLYKEYLRSQDILPFDNTGHILSVAVVATDIFSRKRELAKRNPSAAKTETPIIFIGGQIFLMDQYQKKSLPWYSFSPLALLSPANITEAAISMLVEEEITEKYKKTITRNLSGIVDAVEKSAIKDGYDKEYLRHLQYYKKRIKAPGARE